MSIEIIPIQSIKVVDVGDDIIDIFLKSLEKDNEEIKDKDIIVFASKVVSFSEKNVLDFKDIEKRVTPIARKIAERAKISAEFAQVILEECDYNYIGTVPGAITTYNEYGLLANAGADQSNVGEKRVVLLPKNSKKSAMRIHKRLSEITKKEIGIIIADSRTMPLRLGTVGCALGTYGFKAVLDERGRTDLFNREMHITQRAIADQLATAAELLMGETNEQIPFVIIRGYPMVKIENKDEKDINNLITAKDCMFIGPLFDCIKEKVEKEKNEY